VRASARSGRSPSLVRAVARRTERTISPSWKTSPGGSPLPWIARACYSEVEQRADAARVLAHVADGILLLDRSGVVRLWNPAAEGNYRHPRRRDRRPLRRRRDSRLAGGGRLGADRGHARSRTPGSRHPARNGKRRALDRDRRSPILRWDGVCVPRPDRRPQARGAQGQLHRDGVPRASNATCGGLRRRSDAPPSRFRPRRGGPRQVCLADRRRVGAPGPNRQRDPARQPARRRSARPRSRAVRRGRARRARHRGNACVRASRRECRGPGGGRTAVCRGRPGQGEAGSS